MYPANSNVEVSFIEGDTFEIIPTSDKSILQLNAFPGALGTFYPWLEGVRQFSNILFDMNNVDFYSKWSQGNQGAYQVQFAQYSNCIFWSDNAYVSNVNKRTNYTLYYTSQLPLCYSNIPDNTFKAFFLAFGVNNDPNWGNPVYRESFSKATWATQAFSYYGARTVGIFGHDSSLFNIVLPKDCRGLMCESTAIENAGTFDAINVTNFGAKSGSWRDAFRMCYSLRNLYIKNLKVSLNISWSPVEYDSIYYIISTAANINAITISVSPHTYYLLKESDFELAASKNITIELLTTNYIEDRRLSAIDDWNQNDETAFDYIKNRTHWIEDDGETYHPLDERFIPNTIATKNYVNTKVADLVNSAPETLDTLGELAVAIDENKEVVDALNESITNKQNKNVIVYRDSATTKATMTAPQIMEKVRSGENVYFTPSLQAGTLHPYLEGADDGVFFYSNYIDNTRVIGTGVLIDADGNITNDTYQLGHLKDTTIHITAAEREKWNGITNLTIPTNLLNGTPEGTLRGINTLAESDSYTMGVNAFAIGNGTKASGKNSFASGQGVEATGSYSHAEGYSTFATAAAAHAEGYDTHATARYAHAEGASTTASGNNSHAEGNSTTSSGHYSHAEGNFTTAAGAYSHAEGNYAQTTDGGTYSHVEGSYTIATKTGAHAEGNHTEANGAFSHTEGLYTKAVSMYQHVRGKYNVIDDADTYATIVGNGDADTNRKNIHTLGWNGEAWYSGDIYVGSTSGVNKDDGSKKLATEEYVNTQIDGIEIPSTENMLLKTEQTLTDEELTQVRNNLKFIGKGVEGQTFNINGEDIVASANAEIFGDYENNKCTGKWSIVEGSANIATGRACHVECAQNQALNDGCHVEGVNCIASGYWSHAEGEMTRVTSYASHAEGSYTKMPDGTTRYGIASGYASHIEGGGCHAEASCSHSEGLATTAKGNYSHSEGRYTIASSPAQHVEGVANIEDANSTYIHIAGNGDWNARSNAYTLDWDGNGEFAGDVIANGCGTGSPISLVSINSAVESLKTEMDMSEITSEEIQALFSTTV